LIDGNLINLLSISGQFEVLFNILPYASISNVSIINSKHSNIMIPMMDTVEIQNIFIQNNTLNSIKIDHPIISLGAIHTCSITNLTVKDTVGPILKLQYVLSQRITNCLFENVSSSKELSEINQSQIRIIHADTYSRLNQTKQKIVVIQNVSLNVIKIVYFLLRSIGITIF